MIVLDEGIARQSVLRGFQWYRGRVISIEHLRPHTRILDEAIPALLREVRQPTFVTINTTDFWRRVRADERTCLLCLPLPDHRAEEDGALTRRLFHVPEFKIKKARTGRVAFVGSKENYSYSSQEKDCGSGRWLPCQGGANRAPGGDRY